MQEADIEELVKELRKRNSDKAGIISPENGIQLAKRLLTRMEEEQGRYAELQRLFNRQLERLVERGVPERLVRALAQQEKTVLARAYQDPCEKETIPFVPIIPISHVGAHGLARLLNGGQETDDEDAFDLDHFAVLTATANSPTGGKPYFVFGASVGFSPPFKGGRGETYRMLTGEELLSLALQDPEVKFRTIQVGLAQEYSSDWSWNGDACPNLFLGIEKDERGWKHAFGPKKKWFDRGPAAGIWDGPAMFGQNMHENAWCERS